MDILEFMESVVTGLRKSTNTDSILQVSHFRIKISQSFKMQHDDAILYKKHN